MEASHATHRLDELDALARDLVELLYDPKANSAAERTERRAQARTKLHAVLDAINYQAHASEAYASVFADGGGDGPDVGASLDVAPTPEETRAV